MITLEGEASEQAVRDVVATLKAKGAPATLFLPGKWLVDHPLTALMLVRDGVHLGNRGYTNARFTGLSEAELRDSITRTEKLLATLGAADPRPYLRAPERVRNLKVLRVAGELGYRSVGWTDHAGRGSPDDVASNVVDRARPGSIVSLDLDDADHRAALSPIIDGLDARGLGVAGLDTLLDAYSIRWGQTLKYGSTGPDVVFLQKRLDRLTYPTGPPDGSFAYQTQQAVYAFEKINGLKRDSKVGRKEMELLLLTKSPPKVPARPAESYIDLDISRQILFEVQDGSLLYTISTSTGSEGFYMSGGQKVRAHTPRGTFEIERKILGKRVSTLGTLYDPNYFVGGYAIHGSTSVPPYPASHGCVRLPMYLSRGFYERNPIGTKVYIHD